MQRIHLKADDLDDRNADFEHAELKQSLFLNSVPKSGSHLLRNIMRMFVPLKQHYGPDFIQFSTLQQHLDAFDAPPKLSWGHLFFAEISAVVTGKSKRILLVRDPYTWVPAMARFMMSDQFSGDLDLLKRAPMTPEELFNTIILGIPRQSPGVHETYLYNAVAWMGTGTHMIRFEELKKAVVELDSTDSEAYFSTLFDACGVEMPDDWRERVRVGSDPTQSGTARENLSRRGIEVPNELPEAQKRIVDLVSPNLRSMLGYA